jgi:hypothetical protein
MVIFMFMIMVELVYYFILHFVSLLKKLYFNNKIRKILITFLLGLVQRWFINDVFDINVFEEYTHWVSIIYYGNMSCFIVYIDEFMSFF